MKSDFFFLFTGDRCVVVNPYEQQKVEQQWSYDGATRKIRSRADSAQLVGLLVTAGSLGGMPGEPVRVGCEAELGELDWIKEYESNSGATMGEYNVQFRLY